jgi:diguanylate cyclase (GGDEF)-like protein
VDGAAAAYRWVEPQALPHGADEEQGDGTDAERTPSMWQRTTLLQRFGSISLLLILLLGLVVGVLLRGVLRDRTIEDAQRTAVSVAVVGVQSQLTPDDLTRDFVPLLPERITELDTAMGAAVTVGDAGELGEVDGFVRIKVWNPQHWVVYSDNPALNGRWFPGDDALDDALAGEVTWEVTDLSSPEEFEERDFGELLAVYVPLRAIDGRFAAPDDTSAPFIGASEVYLPWQPIAAAIARDTARLWAVLAIGLAVLYAGLYRLVSRASVRLRRQAAENDYLARHDTLTGLVNRRGFEEQARQRLLGGGQQAVLLLDLDRFQDVNDTLGHDAGDDILRQIATRLTAFAGDGDVVARLGGDEFAVLRSDVDLTQATVLAARIGELIKRPVSAAGLDLDVSGSIGVTVAPDHGTDIGELLRHADIAMYRAKEYRSGAEAYRTEIDHFSADHLELASEVRRAISERELRVFLQPQIDLRTGGVVAAEALIRWEHPTRGMVGPGAFMPVIETTDLIRPVTEYVIDDALRACADLDAVGHAIVVAVNLSAHNLTDRDLLPTVTRLLDRHGLPASRLRLELTESALLHDPTGATQVLTALRDLGIGLSVDDFGTGYASLAYLRDLPVDELKIDRSLVVAAGQGGDDEALLSVCISLGQRLGLTIVAEGIEDAPTLHWLADAGCDLAQGYLTARPMPADVLPAWLVENAEPTRELVLGERAAVTT